MFPNTFKWNYAKKKKEKSFYYKQKFSSCQQAFKNKWVVLFLKNPLNCRLSSRD